MATTLLHSPMLPHTRIRINPTNDRNKFGATRKVITCEKKGDDDELGKPVDDSMVVLRMRIKKMKILETTSKSSSSQETSSPSEWKDWEKKIFSRYHEDVYELICMLQSYLMNTRPSVALGMLAILALSLPLSSSAVATNVLKVVKGLLAGCHVSIDIDF